MENAAAADSSQSNISRLYIWKDQKNNVKVYTDSAEAEKQTENNTSSTENVIMLLPMQWQCNNTNVRTKNQKHCSLQQTKRYYKILYDQQNANVGFWWKTIHF